MSTPPSPPKEPSFGDRMSLAFVAFVRAIVRLFLLVLIAGLIGGGLYFGIPYLYQQYVRPVERNTVRLEDVEVRQQQDREAIDQRLTSLQERLDNQEVLSDQDKVAIADLQGALDDLRGQQEALAAAQADSLARAADLQTLLDRLGEALDDLDGELADLTVAVAGNLEDVEALNEELRAADTPLNSLRRELELLKAMELITRSRVFIAQGNQGLAEQDIQLARDTLAALQPLVLEFQQEELVAIISRLDLALGNVPQSLDLTANDLEVAWQLLVDGLPQEPAAEEVDGAAVEGTQTEGEATTPTPETTPGATPEATPTPTS